MVAFSLFFCFLFVSVLQDMHVHNYSLQHIQIPLPLYYFYLGFPHAADTELAVLPDAVRKKRALLPSTVFIQTSGASCHAFRFYIKGTIVQ